MDLSIKELYAGCLNTSIACQLAGGAVGKPKDIIFGDDLFYRAEQLRSLRELDIEDPYLTVVSFPCDPWTSMSNMFPPKLREAKREEGMIHLEFYMQVAENCRRRGQAYIGRASFLFACMATPSMVV